jgi:cytochrome c553
MNTKLQSAVIAAVGLVSFASSAESAGPAAGDAKSGAAIAATCQGCHGPQGEGVAATGGPRIAGQTENYLVAQLQAYAQGTRTNPIMTAIAKGLDDRKQADAAAFFASQSPPHAAPTAQPTDAQLARGKLLVRTGDESKSLQACANCHGPDGSGERFATPYLAGQSAAYIASAIGEWKTGARHSGEALMGGIASRLDDNDIAAVSGYLESLGQNGK